jgi:uncharacterized protein YqeY
MTLLQKIDAELKSAMTDRNEIKLSTLRMLKAALTNAEIELRPKKKELTEEMALEVIAREIKRHKESIEAFEKGNRFDLADKEKKELEILKGYLPEQLSDEKIREVVKIKINEHGATGPSDFGKVMGLAMKELKGRADGGRIGEIVKKELDKKS